MRSAVVTMAVAALLGACSALPSPPEAPSTYVLEPQMGGVQRRPAGNLVIAVGTPRAYSGFDTAQMAYVRRAHEIEYFTKSRWADAPPRMLAPLIGQALDRAGGFRAVVRAPGGASADLRLDVEIVRLQQDFTVQPSQVRFSLHAQLVDTGSRRVLATRDFDEVEYAPSEDAYGGVIAANRALERLLGRLVGFCSELSAGR